MKLDLKTRLVLVCVLLVSIGLAAREPFDQASSAAQTGRPTYDSVNGPVVAIDDAHKNTTPYARAAGLIKLLQDDGYRPRASTQTISAASLADVSIFIANDPQTTLSDSEVSALVAWLRGGGSLVLALDHYAAMQTKLTASLGVRNWPGNPAGLGVPDVINILFWRSEFFPGEPGVAILGSGGGRGYQTAEAVLAKHAITEGRGPSERIRRVATYSGSAFEALQGGTALLTLPRSARLGAPTSLPNDVMVGVPEARGTSAAGWLQGAVAEFGKGRLAVFADSGVLSGGVAADKDQFMDNRQFVLNLMHWLSRVL